MGLTALICCPGPSLAEAEIDASRYDVKIAINRAIELDIGEPFDWWAFGDDPALDWFTPAHDPKALFMAHKVGKDHPAHRVKEIEWVEQHEIMMWAEALCGTPKFLVFTGVAVLSLCKFVGATKIDIYGQDLAGDKDFRGESAKWNNDERWVMEKLHWKRVAGEIDLTAVNGDTNPKRFTLPEPVQREATWTERILGSKNAEIRAVNAAIEKGNAGWLTTP